MLKNIRKDGWRGYGYFINNLHTKHQVMQKKNKKKTYYTYIHILFSILSLLLLLQLLVVIVIAVAVVYACTTATITTTGGSSSSSSVSSIWSVWCTSVHDNQKVVLVAFLLFFIAGVKFGWQANHTPLMFKGASCLSGRTPHKAAGPPSGCW